MNKLQFKELEKKPAMHREIVWGLRYYVHLKNARKVAVYRLKLEEQLQLADDIIYSKVKI